MSQDTLSMCIASKNKEIVEPTQVVSKYPKIHTNLDIALQLHICLSNNLNVHSHHAS